LQLSQTLAGTVTHVQAEAKTLDSQLEQRERMGRRALLHHERSVEGAAMELAQSGQRPKKSILPQVLHTHAYPTKRSQHRDKAHAAATFSKMKRSPGGAVGGKRRLLQSTITPCRVDEDDVSRFLCYTDLLVG
jgi:hypothetical protein